LGKENLIIRHVGMDCSGVWGRDLGIEGERERERERIERMQERYMKWMMGVNWKTLGYMIREELQRDKLRVRAGRRTWRFDKKLAESAGRR